MTLKTRFEPSLVPSGTNINWREIIQPYLQPSTGKAVFQLMSTVPPFFAVMAVMLIALHFGYLIALLLFPVAAMLLVRLFMFQHDCGHGSFFKNRWANDLLGYGLGILTLTPYLAWRTEHAIHHATVGNLDRRGIGDVPTLTTPEYLALPRLQRFLYRTVRHPLILFGIVPFFVFFLRNRVPVGDPRRHWKDWISVLVTNVGIAAILTLLVWTLGPRDVILGWGSVVLSAATVGMWLFYVQHQFEDVYWELKPQWDFHSAALKGASFYDLPPVLRWLTANIGFHHIHHLSSKIPNYNLRECHNAHPELQCAPRITLWTSFKCANLALWDIDRRQLISFRSLSEQTQALPTIRPVTLLKAPG